MGQITEPTNTKKKRKEPIAQIKFELMQSNQSKSKMSSGSTQKQTVRKKQGVTPMHIFPSREFIVSGCKEQPELPGCQCSVIVMRSCCKSPALTHKIKSFDLYIQFFNVAVLNFLSEALSVCKLTLIPRASSLLFQTNHCRLGPDMIFILNPCLQYFPWNMTQF